MNKFNENDVAQNKVMGILAYLGFLFLVPMLAAKDSPYARFHANQGLVLFIVEFVYGIITAVLSIAFSFIPVVGAIVIAVLGLLSLVFVVLAIIGIINACNGDVKGLPIIGNIQIIK